MLIDTHCHIFNEYYDDIEELVDEMHDGIIIVSGDNKDSNKEVLELCQKYYNVYGTVGYHPEFAKTTSLHDLDVLETYLNYDKIVGVGEIGLDYHYNKDDKQEQIDLFKKQIFLAQKYKKPIVVHSRDAAEDTYDILSENLNGNKCIMHCYSYSVQMAYKFKKLGIKFGVGGTLTFKNNRKTVEVVSDLNLTDFVLETDSPFLTPEPYRGKNNRPYYVSIVAKKIAELKNTSYDKVVEATSQTAKSVFDLRV